MANCSLIDHIAGDLVQQGFDDFNSRALQFRNDANNFLNELIDNENLDLSPVNLNIVIDLDLPEITPPNMPAVPGAPTIALQDVDPPVTPGLEDVVAPSFDDPPEESLVAPVIALPPQPDALDADAPGDAPTVADVTLPDVPDVSTLPDVPTMLELALPDIPDLALPTWSGVAPTANLVPPGETFAFVADAYDDDLLDTVKTKVGWMLEGGTGIPSAVWDSIWDRGRAREQETSRKLIDEASGQWAARGFEIPPGPLLDQVLQVRQAVQTAEATLSREIAIKAAEMEQTNLQFAVQQGIALENVLISLHNSEQERAYQVARFAQEAAIAVFNAKVAYFNAQLAAYQTEATVFKTLVEGELAKLETYKARLEGERLKGEINELEVRIYVANLEGLKSKVELYRAQVEGVRALVEVDQQRIEAYKATVEAYGERVKAKQAEVQQYAEAVRGEMAKTQIYELESNVFARRIEAWKAKTGAQTDQARFNIDINESRIRQFASTVDAYRARVAAEAERVRSEATVYDASTKVYSAAVQGEATRIEAETRTSQLILDKGRIQADLELRQAGINVEQVQRLLALELERIKVVNNVHAQLAAATMAAVNLSAGIHEGASNSTSCSETYQFSS